MKIRILLLGICALFLLPLSMDAQVTKYIKKKGKRAVKTAGKTTDKEVDKEIDKKVKKGVLNLKNRLLGEEGDTKTSDESKTENQEQQVQTQNKEVNENAESTSDNSKKEDVSKKKSGGGMGALSAIMGGGGGDVAHKDSYNFDGSIVMEMEALNADDGTVETVMEYTTYFSMKGNDVAIELKPQSEGGQYQGEMTMIYDIDNNTMFMLSAQGGQKMAIASDLDDVPDDMDEGGANHVSSNPSYTKTGKSRTIAGYKCDGYTLQDGENTVEMWVTKDMKFDPGKNQMKKAGIPLYYDGPFEGGMIMEMEMYEDNIKRMRMLVKDVKSNINKSMSLEGYTIMNVDMGGEK